MVSETDGADSTPDDRRIERLIDRMTLSEKAAQLGSVSASRVLDGDGKLDEDAVENWLSDGIGHLPPSPATARRDPSAP